MAENTNFSDALLVVAQHSTGVEILEVLTGRVSLAAHTQASAIAAGEFGFASDAAANLVAFQSVITELAGKTHARLEKEEKQAARAERSTDGAAKPGRTTRKRGDATAPATPAAPAAASTPPPANTNMPGPEGAPVVAGVEKPTYDAPETTDPDDEDEERPSPADELANRVGQMTGNRNLTASIEPDGTSHVSG